MPLTFIYELVRSLVTYSEEKQKRGLDADRYREKNGDSKSSN